MSSSLKQTNKLLSLTPLGMKLGLESMHALLKAIGSPQDSLKVIHIGGTNGKGSTVSYLESIAKNAGVKCGAYTSPALFDFKENIRVSGVAISEEIAEKGLEIIFDACEKLTHKKQARELTSFEVETALAFWYFKQQKCDYVFLETGLGGALDATNVVDKPFCVALTTIDFDHTQQFGDTIEKIAKAECGILKKNTPLIIAPQCETALKVIENEANKLNCKIIKASEYMGELNSTASFAMLNAGLARQIANHLSFSDLDITSGLKAANWFGRFSVVANEPTIILDGAHNEPAIEELINSLKNNYPKTRKLIFIVGIYKDKNVGAMLAHIIHAADSIFTVDIKGVDRLETAENLTSVIISVSNKEVHTSANMTEALSLAKQHANKEDIVIVCGSLSIVAAAAKILNHAK